MKIKYESFKEIAERFTDGDAWTHIVSNHTPEECIGWQHGVLEFANFLDTAQIPVSDDLSVAEGLWKETRKLPRHLGKGLDDS